ncbi:MAG TPA: VWA domain-containing protein [Blastocatellia bacterium]|nr:VWA domain-containing protein [Blastocatellia bacterium]
MQSKQLVLPLILLFGFGTVTASNLQQRRDQQPLREEEPIRLGTTLVQVPVIVSEPGGRYITDMRAEDFALYEDGVKQKIAVFGAVEEPFNVALLLDSSGSTAAQLSRIKAAALAFIDNLRPQDRVMIASFNDSVQFLCDLTGDRSVLTRAVDSIQSGEFTQVYEAVYTAVWERLHDLKGRKAVIVFTDGIDTASSEISEEDTLDAIIESEDIIVYPIRYATRPDVERKIEVRVRSTVKANTDIENELVRQDHALDRTYREADEYLQELADMSGGIVERADQLGDLQSALGRIARELRQQYLLGYYPTNRTQDGKSRKIRVETIRRGARVRSRPEYRMSQQ